MSIETKITKAWEDQSKWLYFLLPLSWLYGLITYIRYQLYKLKFLSSYHANVPVMIVGNITVGGSGKTPLIIALVKHLRQKNIKVAVISRGYGGNESKMPTLVTLDSTPSLVGDEPCLIVQSTIINNKPVPMAVSPNRQQAIELLLLNYSDIQIIISDDGLQHYKLQRDIEWIVVDENRGFGSNNLLPVGFLREPISRLQNATVIYHSVNSSKRSQASMHLKPSDLIAIQDMLPIDIKEKLKTLNQSYHQKNETIISEKLPNKGSKVHGVTGIGYPKRFFDTLRSLEYDVNEHSYPDHYDFNIQDLNELSKTTTSAIIITSKDAVKITQVIIEHTKDMSMQPVIIDLLSRLFILPVSAQLNDQCYLEIDKLIQKLNL